MKKKRVTIEDISRELNLSTATISRVLNNSPKVKRATRELVLDTMEKMNYNKNRIALALQSGKSKIVGVIVPRLNRGFFSSVIKGLEEGLTEHGYHTILCQSQENVEMEKNHVTTLLNAQVDGIFLSVTKSTTNADHLQKILKYDKPLIFFDRKIDLKGTSSVTINDYEGAYQATTHLIEQGCKQIAHFAGNQILQLYRDRQRGYKQALLDHGFHYCPEYVFEAGNVFQNGISAVETLWKLNNPPDGIFSASDYPVVGAIKELKKRQLRIPEDVAIVGFSNEPFTKYMESPISSVDQSPVEMGKQAAKIFIEKMQQKEAIQHESNVVIPPKLLIRKTSVK